MIDLILLCICTASLSCFIETCMNEGMILYSYYKIIEKLPVWLFKPLGGCSYCFGTWLYIIISGVVWRKYGIIFELIGFILGIGLNFISIKIYEKYISNN